MSEEGLGWHLTTSSICVVRWFLFVVIIFYFLVTRCVRFFSFFFVFRVCAFASLVDGCALFYWMKKKHAAAAATTTPNPKTLMKNVNFYGTQVWNTRHITCAPNNKIFSYKINCKREKQNRRKRKKEPRQIHTLRINERVNELEVFERLRFMCMRLDYSNTQSVLK